MKKLFIIFFSLFALANVAFADSTPVIISFQGQLRENSVPVSGNKTMHFRILDVSSNVIWQSDASQSNQVAVAVANGIYTVNLGDTTLANMAALTKSDLDQNKKLYLRVRVGIEDLAPDILLSAVPFAYIAKQAETITQNISAGNSVVLALRQATQNVGIKTTSPAGVFQVSSNYFLVSANGNIGIADSNPANLFEVSTNYFVVSSNGRVGVGNSAPANLFQVSVNALVVSNNGFVGVGVTAPQNILQVSGSILMNDFVTTPSVTANRIYNVSGNLFWNGSQLGSSTQTIIQGTLTIPIILTVTANGTTLINTTGITAVFVIGGAAGNHNLGLSAGVMGQMLIVVGKGGSGSPRLQDNTANGGAIPRLGGATRILTQDKSITLIYNGTDWIEIAYGNN